MNFDLNLENYKPIELEEIFNLPSNYDENMIHKKEDVLRQKIRSDRTVLDSIKNQTLDFLTKAKKLLIENINKNNIVTGLNVYNTDVSLKESSIFAENGSNFVIDRTANSTPYNFSLPGETFPGIINPLKKRTIIKNLNIDTRFRDNYYTSVSTNFHFDIPYKFSSVTSMQLTSFEFIQSYYTIAACLGNNFVLLELPDENIQEMIILPDGNYTGQILMNMLNAMIADLTSSLLQHVYFSLNLCPGPNGNDRVTIGINPNYPGLCFPFTVNFATDINGYLDTTPLQQKFGWLLGFRGPIYAGLSSYISEGVLDLSGPKYIFLVVDDFNNNVNENFFSAFTSSMLNKNILARIAITPNVGAAYYTQDNFGILSASRTYFGPVDIQKMQIQLLDEYGRVLNLNSTDYSFCLALTTIYDL